jgi:subtilisin family serine protease
MRDLKHLLACLGLFFAVSLSSRVNASELVSQADLARGWIVSPLDASSALKIDALFEHEPSARLLFDSKRATRRMKSSGFSRLAHAHTVTLTEASRTEFQKRAASLGVKLRWEQDVELKSNGFSKQTGADPFEGLQWALSNRGGQFFSPVDYLQNEVIEGIAGEDVRIPFGPAPLKPIVVAVLDTGVDLDHSELTTQIYVPQSEAKRRECEVFTQYLACVQKVESESFEPDFTECNERFLKSENDFDQNGFILDCKGWDFGSDATEEGSPRVVDDYGHGTHIAGILAAKRNGRGMRGIGSEFIQILPVRVLKDASPTSPGAGKTREIPVGEAATQLASTVARGLIYAVDNGAQVVNLSLGWPFLQDGAGSSRDGAIRDAFRYARAQGVGIIAASGNDGTDYPILPCSYAEVLCVGSHGPDGRISSFSNYGSAVALFAPGDQILSTIRSADFGESFNELKGYDALSGTSMAAPYVAGAVAWCLASGHPLTECEARLMGAARTPQASPLGLWGAGGLLDLRAALVLTPRAVIVPQERGVRPVVWSGNLSEPVTVSVSLVNLWQATPGAVTLSADFAEFIPASVRDQITIDAAPLTLTSWDREQVHTYDFKVRMRSASAPSELAFEIKLAGAGFDQQSALKRIVRVEIQTRAGANSLSELGVPVETFQVEGNRVPLNQMGVRTVTPLDASGARDYAITEAAPTPGQAPLISIVRIEGGRAQFGIANRPHLVPITIPTGSFVLGFFRADVDGDKQEDYLLRYSYALPEGKVGRGSKWLKLPRPSDGAGATPVEVINYDQLDQAYLPVDHQWIRLPGGNLTPGWVGGGTIPVNERKIIDTTKPYLERKRTRINPIDPLSFYYLASDGLRTVKPPEGWSYAGPLPQSQNDKEQGTATALVVRGRGEELEFKVVRIRAGASTPVSEWVEGVPSLPRLSRYWSIASRTHRLEPGRTQTLVIESYDSGFGFDSIHERADGSWSSESVRRWASQAAGSTRAYLGILAAFSDQGVMREIYTLSKYDLVYRSQTGESRASLRRFSFLPGYQFDASFYPVRTEVEGKIRGAIALPPGAGVSKSLEILTPNREGVLIRPVAGRLLPMDGCKLPLDPVELETSSAFDLFCGNTIRRIHLKF